MGVTLSPGPRRARRRQAALLVAVLSGLVFAGAGWVATRTAPAAAAEPAVQAAAGQQAVTIHGLTIEVPAAWPLDDERCGVPQANTVLRPRDVTDTCLPSTDTSGMTWVDFNAALWGTDDLPARSTTSSFPLGAETARLRHSPAGQRPVIVRLDLADRGVTMKVTAPDEAGVQAVLATARITATDSNGCPATTGALRFPAGAARPTVPDGATSVRVCRYVGGGIEQSALVTGPTVDTIVDELNRLPAGKFDASRLGTGCGQVDRTATLRLRLTYSGSAPRDVTATIGLCGVVGVTDGSRSGRVTNQLMKTLFPLAGGAAMYEAGMLDQLPVS